MFEAGRPLVLVSEIGRVADLMYNSPMEGKQVVVAEPEVVVAEPEVVEGEPEDEERACIVGSGQSGNIFHRPRHH